MASEPVRLPPPAHAVHGHLALRGLVLAALVVGAPGCFESGPIGTGTAGGAPDGFGVDEPDAVRPASDVPSAPACVTTADCSRYEDTDPCNGSLACVAGSCDVDPATIVVCGDTGDPCFEGVCQPETGGCEIQDLCICEPLAAPMVCGESRKLSAFDPGATSALDDYPCPDVSAPGLEHVMLWEAPSDMVARAAVTSGTPAGVWVLHGADSTCKAAQCLNSGPDGVSFLATEGIVYGLVVEHPDPAQSVTLKVLCGVDEESDCGNGSDEDLNGLTDCDEVLCAGEGDCPPLDEIDCADGKDDDVDGLTDCADPGCHHVEPCLQACQPGAPTLRCGDSHLFGTGGGKLEIDTYWGCNAGQATGKGLVFETDFTTTGVAAKVSIQVQSLSPEVTAWVMAETGAGCTPTSCIATGGTSVTFDAEPAEDYYLSIDTPFETTGVDVQVDVTCVEKP